MKVEVPSQQMLRPHTRRAEYHTRTGATRWDESPCPYPTRRRDEAHDSAAARRAWEARDGGAKVGIARGQGQSGTERTTPPTSWSVGRVVQHSNHRKPAFSLSWRPTGTRLPTKGLVTIFPFESRSKNRSAQLARLTTNLPLCSRKTPRRGSVPIYGASRAIAGRSCPGPRRIESHRRSPSPAASPKLFEARR